MLAAIAVWIIGRGLIGLASKLIEKAIKCAKEIEPTLARYLVPIIGVLLNLIVSLDILDILDIFGVQTTSFAVLLAGAGLAIGTAWDALLAHFAAGVLIQVLRSYKVGDCVSVGGVEGAVTPQGLFGATVVSGDNVTNIIGSNKSSATSSKLFVATASPNSRS